MPESVLLVTRHPWCRRPSPTAYRPSRLHGATLSAILDTVLTIADTGFMILTPLRYGAV
jgi:hypothetical protein